MALRLTSPAFGNNTRIPDRHTCEGEDLSPPLQWSGAPSGTKSFVLLCDDPDAPGGTFHHWAMYDIPADQTELHEGYATEAHVAEVGPAVGIDLRKVHQAVNGFGNASYGGPCPPPGHGTHHYHFRLLALDVDRLELEQQADCPAVAAAARPHAIEETELTGTYSR